MEATKKPQPYEPPQTIAITVLIFFGAQLLAAIIFSFLLIFARGSEAVSDPSLPNDPWLTFGFVVLVEAVTLWLLWWFLKRRNLSLKWLGLDKPTAKYAAYASLGFVVYFMAYILVVVLAKLAVPGLDLEKEQEIGFSTASRGIELLPVFVSLVILPPVVEEIVARGFLFGGLRSKLAFWPAAAITSVMFAAAHLNQASEGLLWVAAIDTFVLSIILCYLREKTGSL